MERSLAWKGTQGLLLHMWPCSTNGASPESKRLPDAPGKHWSLRIRHVSQPGGSGAPCTWYRAEALAFGVTGLDSEGNNNQDEVEIRFPSSNTTCESTPQKNPGYPGNTFWIWNALERGRKPHQWLRWISVQSHKWSYFIEICLKYLNSLYPKQLNQPGADIFV